LALSLPEIARLDKKERQETEYLANRIINEMLNSPISAIREEMASGDSFRILQAAERLFDLDDEEESGQPPDEADQAGARSSSVSPGPGVRCQVSGIGYPGVGSLVSEVK
jgi:hypothetical protein